MSLDPDAVKAHLQEANVTVHHVAASDNTATVYLESGLGLAQLELARGVILAMDGVTDAQFSDSTKTILLVTGTT